jgi:uncharacterized membrane protein
MAAGDSNDGSRSASRWWRRLPTELLPGDLAAVVGLVLLTSLASTVPVVSDTPLRTVLALPFVLFLPGYAAAAALFPAASRPLDAETAHARRSGIDGIERIALSFGVSIGVVPLVAVGLNFTPWSIRLTPILLSVGGLTILMSAIAAKRRLALPPDERYRVAYRHWLRAVRVELFEPETRADAALNLLLLTGVLVAAASIGYAIAVQNAGEGFTEFYLLTESDDGELVTAGYPREFVVGQPRQLVVGIENHEAERVRYTVVVLLQDGRFVDDEPLVDREAELDRFQVDLAASETWKQPYQISPPFPGERLRLTFLLYRDATLPATPTADNAYRHVHLLVNVSRAP